MDLNREKFSRTSSFFHSRGRGEGLGQSASKTYRYSSIYLVVFSIFTLRIDVVMISYDFVHARFS